MHMQHMEAHFTQWHRCYGRTTEWLFNLYCHFFLFPDDFMNILICDVRSSHSSVIADGQSRGNLGLIPADGIRNGTALKLSEPKLL